MWVIRERNQFTGWGIWLLIIIGAKSKLAGQTVELTHTEFDILFLLIQNAGKVITHRQIIQKVWGTVYEDELRLLRVNISNLRRKLEPNPDTDLYINRIGVGYRMMDETT